MKIFCVMMLLNCESGLGLWQQAQTSSFFQGKYRYLFNADAFAEGIDCIISLAIKIFC
jgi:hypothetical protein